MLKNMKENVKWFKRKTKKLNVSVGSEPLM